MVNFNKRYTFLLLISLLAFFLRIFWINNIPNSLYSDEADQGYNAYSILRTGRDEHGEFLPVSLRSFGDWKPPLPTFLMIPFIYLFGLNELSVRLPSVMLGLFSIILSYFLVKILLENYQNKERLALLTSFFLSISPWHILQSRSAMLVMVSLFFLLSGIYFFVKSKQKISLLYFSIISFVLSIYSYYGMRLITPIAVIFLIIYYWNHLKKNKSSLFFCFLISFVLCLPILLGFSKNIDVLFGRARTVSIFYDQGIKLRQWELITQDGINYPTFLSRFFHNSFYLYGRNIMTRFFSHFEINYLLFEGDRVQPFQIPNMGIFYLIDPILIIAGIYFLYRFKLKNRNLIIFLLLISFLPASLTFMTPSSNRTFNAIFPFSLLIALGLIELVKMAKVRSILIGAIILMYFININFFMKQYFINLPLNYSDWWNYGYKDVVNYVKTVADNYKNIVLLDDGGMPYAYLLFFNQVNPDTFQKNAIRNYVADRYGFEHVDSYLKYYFTNERKWNDFKDHLQPGTLYIVPIRQAPDERNYIKTISSPAGKILFKIFEK